MGKGGTGKAGKQGPTGQVTEAEYLATYRPADFPRPSVTVDLVILTLMDAVLKVLLVQRREHPFKDAWALPGGFVRVGDGHRDQGEDLDAAARRELTEETGLPADRVYLEQLHAFGNAGRDPRMRVITVAYTALVRPDLAPLVRAGGDAAEADWFALAELEALPMAFDHRDIIQKAVEFLRERLETTDIVFELVPQTFSIPELRAVHEVIKGTAYDPSNFRRRFNRLLEDGVIEQAPGKRITASRPARVFRFKRARGAER